MGMLLEIVGGHREVPITKEFQKLQEQVKRRNYEKE